MHQPITGLVNNAIPEYNALTLPIKVPAEDQGRRWEEGRDFIGSLAKAISKPLNTSAQSSWRLLWLLSLSYW